MVSSDSSSACLSIRRILAVSFIVTFVIAGLAQEGFPQARTNPLFLFKNYFVTGDYVVAGWEEEPPDFSGWAPGRISIPDPKQPLQNGVPATDTSPASGLSRPEIIEMVVVLPAPLGPRRP